MTKQFCGLGQDQEGFEKLFINDVIGKVLGTYLFFFCADVEIGSSSITSCMSLLLTSSSNVFLASYNLFKYMEAKLIK